MFAVRFHRFGKPDVLQLDEVQTPSPTAGQVLVKVRFAGCNPKDCLIRKGKYAALSGRKMPQRVGYDFAGEVAESRSERFKPGERVYGMLNGWSGGTCAEFVVVPENELTRMPARLSFEDAAGVPLAALTALQALRDVGKLEKGDRVCVNGASGGVGVYAVQIAKALGARVTATAGGRNREFVLGLGADEVVDYTQTDILASPTRFHVFFDAFGNKSFKAASRVLTEDGVYVTTVPRVGTFLRSAVNFLFRRKAGLVVVKSNRPDLDVLTRMIESGQIKPVVDRVFPLDRIAEAHAHIETKRARGKVVVQVTD